MNDLLSLKQPVATRKPRRHTAPFVDSLHLQWLQSLSRPLALKFASHRLQLIKTASLNEAARVFSAHTCTLRRCAPCTAAIYIASIPLFDRSPAVHSLKPACACAIRRRRTLCHRLSNSAVCGKHFAPSSHLSRLPALLIVCWLTSLCLLNHAFRSLARSTFHPHSSVIASADESGERKSIVINKMEMSLVHHSHIQSKACTS